MVRSEDLLRHPAPTLRAPLAFLGLPWDDALLSPTTMPERPDPYEPRASAALFGTSIGQWRARLSAADADAVRRVAGPLLEELGYGDAPARVS